MNVGALFCGSGTDTDATTVDGHDGLPGRSGVVDLLVVDVRLGEVVETAVVVHEAACALVGDDGAIGEGEGGGGRLGWLVELDTGQMESGERTGGTDQTAVVELVEGGERTETLCGLFVGMVAYGDELGVCVEEEGAAVGGERGEERRGDRTDRTRGRRAAGSKRSVNW